MNYKLTSTWAEHCPAYYLAINLEKKQVIISIRGTAQVEDVITDLTALPTVGLPHTSQAPAMLSVATPVLLGDVGCQGECR